MDGILKFVYAIILFLSLFLVVTNAGKSFFSSFSNFLIYLIDNISSSFSNILLYLFHITEPFPCHADYECYGKISCIVGDAICLEGLCDCPYWLWMLRCLVSIVIFNSILLWGVALGVRVGVQTHILYFLFSFY